MITESRLGSFEGILKTRSKRIRDIARALRELVGNLDPGGVETPRAGEQCTTYGVGPRKMSEAYAYIMPFGDRVNLGFYHGTAVSDPEGLLEGAGKEARHVKIRDIGAVSSPAIRALVAESISERRAAQKKAASP